jgi:hypothetical protein
MTFIILLTLLFALLLLAAPTLEYTIKWRNKVKRDYLASRGTNHRILIQNGIVILSRKISAFENRKAVLTTQRREFRQKRDSELERCLTMHLVNQELDKIPGIGSVLKDRIISNCFDGTLESLNTVQYVHGIGSEKSYAVSRWAQNMRMRLPQLQQDDFPEKDQILQRFLRLDNVLEQRLTTIRLELHDLEQLSHEAETALKRLSPIKMATFMKAYEKDSEAAEAATRYMIGVYPEWRRMPKWFKTLKEKHGTA